jgi:VanZ family protein
LSVVIGSLVPERSVIKSSINALGVNDKIEHFTAYFALTVPPMLGFKNRRRGFQCAVLMFLLGLMMEGGQRFSPGRNLEIGDMIANGAGVACGIMLSLAIRNRWRSKFFRVF